MVAVVLAAGEGTRMKSDLPKVLHPVCGRPMVEYVLEAAGGAEPSRIVVVVGYGKEQVKATLGEGVEFVEQQEQRGTAHAVLQAEPALRDFAGDVLVLSGDTPLLKGETLQRLIRHHQEFGVVATVLTAEMDNPTGYGRIIRDEHGLVDRIVEDQDATPQEQRVKEVNTGTYVFDSRHLFHALKLVRPDNKQEEYYLTDVFEIFNHWRLPIAALTAADPLETIGVNTRAQLREAERIMRHRLSTPFKGVA